MSKVYSSCAYLQTFQVPCEALCSLDSLLTASCSATRTTAELESKVRALHSSKDQVQTAFETLLYDGDTSNCLHLHSSPSLVFFEELPEKKKNQVAT